VEGCKVYSGRSSNEQMFPYLRVGEPFTKERNASAQSGSKDADAIPKGAER